MPFCYPHGVAKKPEYDDINEVVAGTIRKANSDMILLLFSELKDTGSNNYQVPAIDIFVCERPQRAIKLDCISKTQKLVFEYLV